MSYKLASGLSPQPNVVELADFWEIECLRRVDHTVSILDISQSRGIADDVQEGDAEEHDMELENEQVNVIEEVRRRINSSNDKYPFKLDDDSYILSLNFDVEEDSLWVYIYLLLATRNNMLHNKIVLGIDGTQIFEKLSRDTLINYLGANAKGLNFGTANEGGFYEKLASLVLGMKEGYLQSIDNEINYNPQDDTLDVVAWIPFYDGLPSKIICFGQCKTGTHWQGTIKQLNVSDFLKKWFSRHPAVNPIETFMVADILQEDYFYNRSVNNLFFDRCRVICFSSATNENDWFLDLKTWTQEIMTQFSLSFEAA